MAYLLESAKVPEYEITRQIDCMLRTFVFAAIDAAALRAALGSSITDYEVAVVEQAAISYGAEWIITRNIKILHKAM